MFIFKFGKRPGLHQKNLGLTIKVLTHKFKIMPHTMDYSALVSTLDSLMEGFQLISPEWKYLYVNETVVKHARCSSKKELIGRTMMEVFPGIEKTAMFKKLEDAMFQGLSSDFENEFIFPDGKTGWFELRVRPVNQGIFVLSFDITEKKLLSYM